MEVNNTSTSEDYTDAEVSAKYLLEHIRSKEQSIDLIEHLLYYPSLSCDDDDADALEGVDEETTGLKLADPVFRDKLCELLVGCEFANLNEEEYKTMLADAVINHFPRTVRELLVRNTGKYNINPENEWYTDNHDCYAWNIWFLPKEIAKIFIEDGRLPVGYYGMDKIITAHLDGYPHQGLSIDTITMILENPVIFHFIKGHRGSYKKIWGLFVSHCKKYKIRY